MRISILLLLGIIVIVSCDKKENTLPEKFESYPLFIGNEWIYNREVIVKKFESEASNNIIETDTMNFTVRVWVEKDTILCDTMAVKQLKSQEEGSNWTSEQYMFIDSEGLKCYAYSNAGEPYVFAKKTGEKLSNNIVQFFGLHMRFSSESLGIIVEDRPTLNIKIPAGIGTKWTFRHPTETEPLQIDKNVKGYESVNLIGKTFHCYKVSWDYLYDPNYDEVKITDWISKEGLVKRQMIFDRATYATVNGEPIGSTQMTETITIKELNLKK